MKDSHKDVVIEKYIPFMIFLVFLVIYLAFLSKVQSLTHDSIYYSNEIEELKIIYHPHHLLYHVFSLLWFKILNFFNVGGWGFERIASLNSVFGAAGISVIYLILKKNFNLNIKRALIFSAISGFSFGYWFYSISVEVYIIPLFFILLSFKFYLDKKNIIYIALTASAAVLFHQANILFGFAIFISLILISYGSNSKLKNLLIFSSVYSAMIIIPYVLVIHYLGLHSREDIVHWLFKYNYEVNSWNTLSPSILLKDFVGYSRALISSFGFFRIEELNSVINKVFQGKNFQNELYLLNGLSRVFVYSYIVLTAIFVIAYFKKIIEFIRNFKKLIKNEKLILMFLFLGFYIIFFSLWDSANVEFWIPQATIIWILLAVNSKKKKYWNESLLLSLLVLINFFYAVLPSQNINNDYYYAKAVSVREIRDKEYVMMDNIWIYEAYFERFTDKKVIQINKNEENTFKNYVNDAIVSPDIFKDGIIKEKPDYFGLKKFSINGFDWYISNK